YATTRSLFSWKRIKLLMQRLGFEEAEARSIVSELGHSTSNTSSSEAKLESFSRLEMECYAANQLLRETDLYGMRHSLEIRVPFIDLELSKTISRLPEEIRFLPNKQILKKAFPEIPSQIFSRPKTGFTLPWDQWIHSQLKHHFEPIDRSFSGMRLTWFQKMAILSLNHWAKNHNFSLKVG
ncbi:MAG: asparagine synthase-related protein, partial [Verrucomicrobiota bacterium]